MTLPYMPNVGLPAPAPDLTAGPPPDRQLVQFSFSGTPNMAGMSRPDDYAIPLQDPINRMMIFEQMRNDQAVHTALSAREHMMKSSNWAVSSVNDTPPERQIAEFVEDNVFPLLGQLISWLGGGAMQYGFGMCEPVYAWSDRAPRSGWTRGGVRQPTRNYGRMIYLKKIAHVRQRTVWTFRLNPTGDQQSIAQYAWDGFTLRLVELPPWKMAQMTYNRQGDDFWGVPPTRNVYKAYTLKTEVERLNIVNIERFGVGLPVAEAGPTWSDADYTRLATFLQAWRSGTNNFIIHPAGGKITVVTATGETTASVLDVMKYYDLVIAKNFLTQGSELGGTESGSRALGQVMYDQSEGIVQSDDEDLADVINEQIIIPLVQMNFGARDAYPQLIPSQRVHADSSIAQILNTLIQQGSVTWRPEDEQWLRDALGMPDIAIEDIEKAKIERDAKAAAIATQQQAADPKNNAPNNTPANEDDPPEDKPPVTQNAADRVRKLLQLIQSAPGSDVVTTVPQPATWDDPHRTQDFSMWEAAVLRPTAVGRLLDTATDRIAGEIQDALAPINAQLCDTLKSAALNGTDALTAAVRTVAVSMPARKPLRDALTAAAQRSRAYGVQTVSDERDRQRSISNPDLVTPANRDVPWYPSDPTDFLVTSDYRMRAGRLTELTSESRATLATWFRKWIALASDAQPGIDARTAAVTAAIEQAVEDEIARRETAARSAANLAISLAGPTVDPDTLAQAVNDAARDGLGELSPARTRDNVAGVVNSSFGAGRGDGHARVLDESPDDVISADYSAVMDLGTCDECEKWDGGRFPPEYAANDSQVKAPNPRCQGTIKRCRCQWILRYSDEEPTNVPPSKGFI